MSDSLNLAYDPVSLLEICLTYLIGFDSFSSTLRKEPIDLIYVTGVLTSTQEAWASSIEALSLSWSQFNCTRYSISNKWLLSSRNTNRIFKFR